MFLTKNDFYWMKVLPRELLFGRLAEFIRAVKDAGVELVILVALRKLVKGNLKDPEVAEAANDALDEVTFETGAAIALAHHDRKAPAETAEARGFGSTMVSANPDAIFDLARTHDGARVIEAEARYSVVEKFHWRRVTVGDGELIRFAEDPEAAKAQQLRERVARGETINSASKALGIPYSSAYRIVHGEVAGLSTSTVRG